MSTLNLSSFVRMEKEQLDLESVKDLLIDESIKLIVDASERLKCTVFTRSKALIICHSFKACVDQVKYDDALVAAASLSLSIKFYEEPVEFDNLIHVFFSILEGVPRCTIDRKMKMIRKSLTMMECLILRMLEFFLNHGLAHTYLAYYVNDIQEALTSVNVFDVFVEMSMKMACDFYLSRKCITYKADEIAIAVVQASLYILGIDVNTRKCHFKNWLQALNKADESVIMSIIEDIFKICNIGPVAENLKKRDE